MGFQISASTKPDPWPSSFEIEIQSFDLLHEKYWALSSIPRTASSPNLKYKIKGPELFYYESQGTEASNYKAWALAHNIR
jgi:hypothetical protein